MADQDPAYQLWTVPKRGFFVYRAWGVGDISIYVGMVGVGGPGSLSRRLGQHRRHAEWWPEMVRIDWRELGNEAAASAEEAKQIAEQYPVHNQRRRRTPRKPPTPVADRLQEPWGTMFEYRLLH